MPLLQRGKRGEADWDRAWRVVASGVAHGHMVAVWGTAGMIPELVAAHCAEKWGPPSKLQQFHDDLGSTVDVLKWSSTQTGEGVAIYVTAGASATPLAGRSSDHRIEFFTGLKPERDEVMQRLATLAAYPARKGISIAHGHTMAFDEPLWAGSQMRAFLILRQRELVLPPLTLVGGFHVEFLQVVPVFESEVAFKKSQGPEALLRYWRDKSLRFWDSERMPDPAP